jgi:dephospho-CoA kinase
MFYRNCIVVAVTGGIGCGQTTVCKFLEEMGAKAIQADWVAKREIESNEEIRRELVKSFGNRIFYRNGKLNRKLLAKIAFSDEAKTERLNRIVHPQMVSSIISLIEEARESQKFSIILVDAALIYELSLEHMFDAVVVVSSKMSQRLERIRKRDNLTNKEIMDRINKQIPIEDKKQWADFLIENNEDLETLKKNSRKLFYELRKLARKKSQITRNQVRSRLLS